MSSPEIKMLIGCWVTDPEDKSSLALYGSVALEFKANGELVYTIHEEKRDRIMNLTYEVVGDTLIIDQPSEPRKQETKFVIASNGKLRLGEGESISWFLRL